MRYSAEHSEETRRRMLEAAGRAFREQGYGGIGVDGLAKAAGVTSGAFYRHFPSKAEAFRAVVVAGLDRLRQGVELFRRRGDDWFGAFARYYLGPERRRDVPGGCTLPSLSTEVGRAGPAARRDYQVELERVAATLADGLPGAPTREAAWPLLAQLVGAVVLARAVEDEALAAEIAQAVLAELDPQG